MTEQIDKRKAYMKKYQREYHRTPEMVKYMKEYHADPKNKAAAIKRSNEPEQKERTRIASKRWRDSESGKAWMKDWNAENIETLRANSRRAYHKRMAKLKQGGKK